MDFLFAMYLSSPSLSHKSTFTHADLQRKNILVSWRVCDRDNSNEICFSIGVMLDSVDSGWNPSYWEYADSFVDLIWEDD